jgi:hypothetical protein
MVANLGLRNHGNVHQPLTRIHLGLGIAQSPLDYALILKAVESRIPEESDLDWKRAVPPSNEEASQEFAKDVASMANADGGLIVYGVVEDDGKASNLQPSDVSELIVQRFRSWASAHIRPLVPGLLVLPLPNPAHPETGVVAVYVPASDQSPHFVTRSGWLRAPVRYGAQTRYLSEPEIARAYAGRTAAAKSLDERLGDRLDRVLLGLDRTNTTWLRAVGIPTLIRQSIAKPVSREEFTSTVRSATKRARELWSEDWAPSTLLDEVTDAALNPRTGYRSRLAEDRSENDAASFGNSIRVELHDDGSISFAAAAIYGPSAAAEGIPTDGRVYVEQVLISAFARDVVALIDAHAGERGISAQYLILADLVQARTRPQGMLIWGAEDVRGFVRPASVISGSRMVLELVPVRAAHNPNQGEATDLTSAVEIAQDFLHQFSVETVHGTRTSPGTLKPSSESRPPGQEP